MEVIKAVCDRVAVMDAGRVIESGKVLDVFREPKHEVTRALIGDVIAQELPRGLLDRLRARLAQTQAGAGRDHLFRFAFTGAGVDEPLLSEAVRRFGIDFSILHGQIDEIQGQAFGSLAVLASGEAADVGRATEFFRQRGVTIEELNHVL
jgi:D-methionine transport system ATP-binding protein